jgi:F-type H+-transporting ATPase subunit b
MPQLEQIATFPSQVFWLVTSFLVLFVIMWRIAVPKITDALEARQKRIDNNLERAAELKKEAEAAIETYEKSLAKARSDAENVIATANASLAKAISSREAELSDKLQAKIAESEASIATAMNAAAETLRGVAIEVTLEATERLVGETPSNENASAAVDRAIDARG